MSKEISIHPPRVGWDQWNSYAGREWKRFQSTHPVWGGTCCPVYYRHSHHQISIHPPRVGWDFGPTVESGLDEHFNPPTPCGVGLW